MSSQEQNTWPLSAIRRMSTWLWPILLFIWLSGIIGVAVNILATWLTTKNFDPQETPLAWLLQHRLLVIIGGCVLLLVTFMVWHLGRSDPVSSTIRTSDVFFMRHFAAMVSLLLARYFRRYRSAFIYTHRDLDMKGISTRGTYTVHLQQVFVKLRIDPTTPLHASNDPLRLPPALHTRQHTFWDYLAQRDSHLVVLGSPGSGKTTLLKQIGLSLLTPRQRKFFPSQRPRWNVPILLTLRDVNRILQEHPQCMLADVVMAQLHHLQLAIPYWWIERILRHGRCLILLDGLDEIALAKQRKQIAEWVQEQILVYGHRNRFVVTSRPLGYQLNPLERVTVLEVQPFSWDQVAQFLSAWYAANEIERAMRDDPGVRMKSHEASNNLLQRLRATPTLYALAVNPLLLTMIAIVHLDYGPLPSARTTLYKAICEVFLNRRAQEPGSPQDMRAEQRRLILQPLAYYMMKAGKQELPQQEVYRVIRTALRRISPSLSPKEFLQHLDGISSNLFLERESGCYGFVHQTFQEYLAMVHMQEHHLEQELLSHLEESWWHETILLYYTQADATPVLQACLTRLSPSLELLTLAIECAEDARDMQVDVKEHFEQWLQQGVEDADPIRREVVARALLTRRLRHMRPLTKMVYADTSPVTCVEYQLFLNQRYSEREQYIPDHWKEQRFLAGQGTASMLGVKAVAAEAFCRWLTQHDQAGWRYRLPRVEERSQMSALLKGDETAPYGYWEEGGRLVWPGGQVPAALQQEVTTRIRSALSSAWSHYFGPDPYYESGDHPIERAVSHALDENEARIYDRVHTLAFESDRAHARALDLIRVLNLTSDLTYPLDLTHHKYLARDYAFDRVPDRNFSLALELYFILSLLIEQSQGAYPAYDGVILVKEPAQP